jgi:hypothetical protein
MLMREPNLVRAAREVMAMGPRTSWPSRASTAPRCSRATASSRCRPTRSRPWSTRPAPATRSPAASSATWTPSQAPTPPTTGELRRAMTYGSVLASFNVEEFGTERVRG